MAATEVPILFNGLKNNLTAFLKSLRKKKTLKDFIFYLGVGSSNEPSPGSVDFDDSLATTNDSIKHSKPGIGSLHSLWDSKAISQVHNRL